MNEEAMGDHQKQALNQAAALLGEHFDAMVIVVNWEVDGQVNQAGTQLLYKGGRLSAIGALVWGQQQLVAGSR